VSETARFATVQRCLVIATSACPFVGQEIDAVPLEILQRWLATVAKKYAANPPQSNRLALYEAVKESVARRSART
jgi:hypothetical protein